MSTERVPENNLATAEAPGTANIVGWAGIGFALIATGLYGVLFYKLHQLPGSQHELEEMQTNAPALTRLLVVAAYAALSEDLFNAGADLVLVCCTEFSVLEEKRAARDPRTLDSMTSLVTRLL